MKTRGIILILIIMLIGINNTYATSNNQNNGFTQKLSQIDEKYTEISVQTNKITAKITAEQARKIAKTYIEVQGAYPGNPTLFYQKASGNFKGGYVWNVPIMINCKCVNKIMIDAQTGANLGEK